MPPALPAAGTKRLTLAVSQTPLSGRSGILPGQLRAAVEVDLVARPRKPVALVGVQHILHWNVLLLHDKGNLVSLSLFHTGVVCAFANQQWQQYSIDVVQG